LKVTSACQSDYSLLAACALFDSLSIMTVAIP
jgi:hypothetical protein